MTPKPDELGKAFRLYAGDTITHIRPLPAGLYADMPWLPSNPMTYRRGGLEGYKQPTELRDKLMLASPFTMEQDGWMYVDCDGTTARVERVEYDDGSTITPD